MRPIGIDLFSGAGGMSLGFERAGFDVVAAVEIDPVHAAVHKYNFPECVVIPESVENLTAREIRKAAGIGNAEIDVVFGGAPCQGFSMIGQRAIDDPRNSLVKHFVRLVSELEAKSFVFENVKGLTVGKHKKFLTDLIHEFETQGYNVQKSWKVLNAADYGVPQDRKRLFLMGSKPGFGLPSYPDSLEERISCADALADLPDVENFVELKTCDSVKWHRGRADSSYARALRCETTNAWAFGYKRAWDINILTSSSRTDHTEISRKRFGNTAPGKVEPISRFFKLPEEGVSNTLRAGTDSSRGAFTSPRPIHFKFSRCITVREMARLHGFPDWFRFHVTKWHGARQIGNAVPPPLAQAVASSIIAILDKPVSTPDRILDLGDETLLSFTNQQAADYFGIRNPIGKRDKKSGAKKRSQYEIEASNSGDGGNQLIDRLAS